MFSMFHIYHAGHVLCHATHAGIYIQLEDAAGMNDKCCCRDCHRRYVNIAKMSNLEWNMKKIDKALLRSQAGFK